MCVGQIYWVYLGTSKYRVLILETNGEKYTVSKLCQTPKTENGFCYIGRISGSDHEYRVDIDNSRTIQTRSFLSYICDLPLELFDNVYQEFIKSIQRKKKKCFSIALKVAPKKHLFKKQKKIIKYKKTFANYERKYYSKQTWLPFGNTRIRVFRG
ncbi:hypothetical protein U6B65_05600 [Oscillospiraceae bacterium MB08-C2-2]|nr:hypothetical protein U6B65_05600 [Oscillospiraceae bacterium MB08-C2-2]